MGRIIGLGYYSFLPARYTSLPVYLQIICVLTCSTEDVAIPCFVSLDHRPFSHRFLFFFPRCTSTRLLRCGWTLDICHSPPTSSPTSRGHMPPHNSSIASSFALPCIVVVHHSRYRLFLIISLQDDYVQVDHYLSIHRIYLYPAKTPTYGMAFIPLLGPSGSLALRSSRVRGLVTRTAFNLDAILISVCPRGRYLTTYSSTAPG
ncbi:hypothetical protein IW262DRAFT_577093 [Armillaria fumosa]|nr:hypothetical protein IW262DRAFT_577093 [Armillaria fumosa]